MANNKTPTMLSDIEKRYKKRMENKKVFDADVSLSAKNEESGKVTLASKPSTDGYVRLLDEGYVMDQSGMPDFYIKRGVVDKIYNALDNDYVGSVNLGHMSYSNFPFVLGTFTKKDLRVVSIGDDRKALEVKPNLDEESLFVKEIRRQGIPLGISIEMSVEYDWSTETMRETGVPTVEDAEMFAYGIVGEAGNAASGGLNLGAKGDEMSLIEKMKAKYAPDSDSKKADIKDEPGVNSDGKVEMSVEDHKVFMECLKSAETIVENKEKEEKEALEVLKAMDEKIDALTKENKELAAKLEDTGVEKEELSAKVEKASAFMQRCEELTKKLQATNKKNEEKSKVNLKVEASTITEEDLYGGDI